MFAIHPLLTSAIAASTRAERERAARDHDLARRADRRSQRSPDHPSPRTLPAWRTAPAAPVPTGPSPAVVSRLDVA